MLSFPVLKSGAAAQYPLENSLRTKTQVVSFLDGSSQRFSLMRPLRRWRLELSQMDEQEMNTLIDFVETADGEPFVFTDPVSGQDVPGCVIQSGFEVIARGALNNDAVIVVEETL